MNSNTLWSLRLGFTAKQAGPLESKGIENFLKDSYAYMPDASLPGFLNDTPKTLQEIHDHKIVPKDVKDARKLQNLADTSITYDLKAWWIDRMIAAKYPLREKLTVFFHNHFVSGIQSYRVSYWAFQHNNVLRENAFGNLRDITKKILRTNAMVYYLDNNKNKIDSFNENLSRELLELFTLGIGNYTEQDVKNGARGLAGLTLGNDGAVYNPKLENKTPFTYLGKTGNFKSDEMVDIIFEHKNAPYFITKKILKWFIYDNPPEELVVYYGNYLRSKDYEMKPFLTKIFTEEFKKPTAGSKIKDPLVYILQLMDELNVTDYNNKLTAIFLANQSMDLFHQPNVKGWDGGASWLTAQLFLLRNNTADLMCRGRNINASNLKSIGDPATNYKEAFEVHLDWKKGNNKDVIAQFKDRLLFSADEDAEKDFELILEHDFNPSAKDAPVAVMKLFNYMVKTPEFQII